MGAENICLPPSLLDLYQNISNGVNIPQTPSNITYTNRLRGELCLLTRENAPNPRNIVKTFISCLSQTIPERNINCPLAVKCPMANSDTTIGPKNKTPKRNPASSIVLGGSKKEPRQRPQRHRGFVQPLDVSYTYDPDLIYDALLERVGNSDNPLASDTEQHIGHNAEQLLGIVCRSYAIKEPRLAVAKLISNAKERIPEVKAKYPKLFLEI